MSFGIEWHKDPNVIVKNQLAIAIYWNERGEIAIVQEATAYEDSDILITISPANVRAVIDKLIELVDEIEERDGDGVGIQTPKDPTAADRQRRYRNNKRKGTNVIDIQRPEAAE